MKEGWFSSFEMIHGRNLRGPLEVMKEGWFSPFEMIHGRNLRRSLEEMKEGWFSPFEMIHGRNLRGPLEVMKEGWFSPFEMIHGRNLRGPLEVMKEGWLSREVNFVSSIEWVNELRENLANVYEVMKEREKEDKRKMKERYDIRAVERTFNRWYWFIPQKWLESFTLCGRDHMKSLKS